MKVALADPDPQLARAVDRALVGSDHALVWHAQSGAETRKRCANAPPDILLLGLQLADQKALALARELISKKACAVLVLTAAGADISGAYEVMAAGAIDAVKAPRFGADGELIGKSELLAKLRTAGRLLGKASAEGGEAASSLGTPALPPLVAIGASTGGPQALSTVLSALPKPFPGAIIIVQHVDGEFSAGLASWLAETSGLRVELARAGVVPGPGLALLAATEEHLVMGSGGSLRYSSTPRELPYRPSVDVLFQSLVRHWRVPGMAVLLTGMGRDGAAGMAELRKAGWFTVAQDEATSVVYGMPRAAVQLGAAMRVIPIEGVAAEIAGFVARAPRPKKPQVSRRPVRR